MFVFGCYLMWFSLVFTVKLSAVLLMMACPPLRALWMLR